MLNELQILKATMTSILFVTDLFWESYLTLMFLSLHICPKGLITYFSLKVEKSVIVTVWRLPNEKYQIGTVIIAPDRWQKIGSYRRNNNDI